MAFFGRTQKERRILMDDRTRILICLGSAIAANCVACFQHYHKEALKAGVEPTDIDAAVKLGAQVKKGAHITLMNAVDKEAGRTGGEQTPTCCEPAQSPCCSERK
jgi:AhpD family alkylhydroperoxidase